jgi:predicted ATPase
MKVVAVETVHCAEIYRFELNERKARAVAEIYRQLDGVPLALELAAAHLR